MDTYQYTSRFGWTLAVTTALLFVSSVGHAEDVCSARYLRELDTHVNDLAYDRSSLVVETQSLIVSINADVSLERDVQASEVDELFSMIGPTRRMIDQKLMEIDVAEDSSVFRSRTAEARASLANANLWHAYFLLGRHLDAIADAGRQGIAQFPQILSESRYAAARDSSIMYWHLLDVTCRLDQEPSNSTELD